MFDMINTLIGQQVLLRISLCDTSAEEDSSWKSVNLRAYFQNMLNWHNSESNINTASKFESDFRKSHGGQCELKIRD